MMLAIKIAVDSSVIVKWFKKGEEFEREALVLKDEVLSGTITLIMSEWVFLEVVRGLTKAGYPKDKVIQAYDILKEMVYLGFIEVVPVTTLLEKAKELVVELNLYASDAVNLASALMKKVDVISEDKHLLRNSVKNYAKKFGVRIYSLREFYRMGLHIQ